VGHWNLQVKKAGEMAKRENRPKKPLLVGEKKAHGPLAARAGKGAIPKADV